MPFIIKDTESNGLFDFRQPADAPGQPRVAEVALLYVNDALEIEREYRAYVKPDGWEMTPEASAINGLTTEFLEANGVPIMEVLAVYSAAIVEGRAVVAFNAQHDCKQMRGELRRAGLPDLFKETRNVCVMRKANGHILKAGGKKGWPSLAEARTFLQRPVDRPHGALSDAFDAYAIFKFLHGRGVDLTPEVHYAADDHPAKPKDAPPRAERQKRQRLPSDDSDGFAKD